MDKVAVVEGGDRGSDRIAVGTLVCGGTARPLAPEVVLNRSVVEGEVLPTVAAMALPLAHAPEFLRAYNVPPISARPAAAPILARPRPLLPSCYCLRIKGP